MVNNSVNFLDSETRLIRLTDHCSVAVMLIGLFGVLVSVFEIELRTGWLPLPEPMKLITAMCFLLAGAGLLYRKSPTSRITFGFIMFLVGAITLVENAPDAYGDLDPLVILGGDKSRRLDFFSRMSPITAFCFLCSGLALSLLGCPQKTSQNIRELLVVCVIAVGLITVFDYLISIRQPYQLINLTSIPFYPGFTFLILSIGILGAIPNSLLVVLLKTWRSHQQIWFGFGLLKTLLIFTGLYVVSCMSNQTQCVLVNMSTKRLLFGVMVVGIVLAFLIIKRTIAIILRKERDLRLEQNALRQSQLDFSRAQEVGQMGWWRLDTVQNVLTWSDECYRIFGVPLNTRLNYEIFLSTVHPDDLKFVDEAWKNALQGELYDIEHRIVINNQIKWVRAKAYLEFDDSGGPSGGFGIAQDITERKLIEIELNDAKESLSIAIEAAQMGVWDLDLLRDYSGHRSLRHDQIFGYDSLQTDWGMEIARRHVIEEDKELFDSAFVLAKTTGNLKCDVRVRWADGSVHWIALVGRFYYDKQGNPVRGVGVNYDITRHKEIEKLVSKQRDDLEWIYQNAPIGLCEFDLGLRYQHLNQVLADINGLSITEHLGKTVYEIIPTLSTFVEDIVQEILVTKRGVVNKEFCGETNAQPGVQRFWNASWYPVFDDQKAITGFGVVVEEITERKKIEDALKISEERSRLAQRSAHVGVWDWNLSSGKLSWTPELERLHGYSEGGFAGSYESFLARVHPDDIALIERWCDEAINTGTCFDFDFRVLLPFGEIRWLNCKGGVFFDQAGRPERMLGVNIDITQRRLIEDALCDADRRKDEFLAMLGHELRNPLVPLNTVAQILSAPTFDVERLKWMQGVLQRNIQHITQLVDDLLDVSRITQGVIKINKQKIDLNKLLKDAAESVQAQIRAKQQVFHLYLPRQAVVLVADPIRLTQVITNLLNNAIKYTFIGGQVDLSVNIKGANAHIHIKDNGAGIEAELLPNIFDLFVQGKRSLSRSEGGLGIGLTLVKKLVELHDGEITVKSKGINHGAEFIVCLPGVEDGCPEGGGALLQEQGVNNMALKILLIDDNVDVAESLASWLELAGHKIMTAYNGTDGLLGAKKFKPDIVILDIGLPDMTGYDVAQALRLLPDGNKMLLIGMSGYAPSSKELVDIDYYLIKPPRIDQLQQLISNYQKAKTVERAVRRMNLPS